MERRELLTHSRMSAFKECRRKHWYSYELGLRRIDDARALRMGSAMHDGIDALGNNLGVEVACERIDTRYANCPDAFDGYRWAIEHETMRRLVCAYDWRWGESPIENVCVERAFSLPLINPATGRQTPSFDLGGKIDGVVRLEDGRLAVKETKTVSEDIGPDSPLWRRLRMDQQITLYLHAARELGFPVETVLYDVIRKPTIDATPVPLTDEDGKKIVLDAHGERIRNTTGKKEWRQTADVEKGYVLQTRSMSPDEWGEKLTADIVSRPDYYFARVEIARLDADIEEFKAELWDVQLSVRDAQKNGRHYRTVNRNSCGFCTYFDLCCTGQEINPAYPPAGFTILTDPHPELERVENLCESAKDAG